ncbi:hypothetical protein ASE14_10205 [Agromyces sp. Root81]|uniref:hypothetical protein n=1 Tax=Agromyces sp. Root81 TaxID=1736601 RepID=UPI0006F90F2B|nr:hypothetical protein [Agromyces sp. Root81]KRC61268.1 hypothetical protein ASE14_10205 [Agromyces sp. Root81]
MMITVDDNPVSLVELLWIREAWGLQPRRNDDHPPLLVDSPGLPMNDDEEFDIGVWEAAWPDIWTAVLRHAGEERDPGLLDAVRSTADNSAERADLIAQITGPSWRDRFGGAGLDELYQAWTASRFRERVARPHTSFEDQPERRSLDALTVAWRSGLTKIVTIPCRGEFARTIGEHTLLTTDATRSDVDTYSAALRQFG